MGIPLFSIIENVKEDDLILIEASSYMLESTFIFKPNIYVVTNIYPNHLDHHLTIENYYLSKLKVINRLKEEDIFINLSNQELINEYIKDLKIKKSTLLVDDLILNEYTSFDKVNLKTAITILFYIFKYLKYSFNYLELEQNLKSLTKEEFRYQTIYKDQELTIINDSKSTNPYSGLIAIKEALKEKDNIILIAGGKISNHDYSIISSLISEVNEIYLFGENRNILYDCFKLYNKNIYLKNTLNEIIKLIKIKKGLILFSPMSQSLDQYESFVERGKEFNKLIIKSIYN